MSFECKAENCRPVVGCGECLGTRRVDQILWRGRYRTRVQIVKWLLSQREWKGARVGTTGTVLIVRLGSSCMRLDGFTVEEIDSILF